MPYCTLECPGFYSHTGALTQLPAANAGRVDAAKQRWYRSTFWLQAVPAKSNLCRHFGSESADSSSFCLLLLISCSDFCHARMQDMALSRWGFLALNFPAFRLQEMETHSFSLVLETRGGLCNSTFRNTEYIQCLWISIRTVAGPKSIWSSCPFLGMVPPK